MLTHQRPAIASHVAPPYCYRCSFGLSYPSCGLACVKNIEATILGEGPEGRFEVN
jgi:taurine-pyruvate aminotransferase